MADLSSPQVTRLLRRVGSGDREAADELLPAVYHELRERAARSMRGERAGHTLQTTALVHEAWMRLVDQRQASWTDRSHFYAIAATCIRRILLDHARRKNAQKRRVVKAPVDPEQLGRIEEHDPAELLALDDALERLAENDPRKARVVELRFFGGMQIDEIASVLEVSVGTVERDLRLSRAWLHRELERGTSA